MSTTSTYDHEAMLDDAKLGNPPSEAYLEHVKMFDNVVRECMYVSKSYAGIPSPTSRHFYASVLFTALITRGVSLAILAPFTPWAQKLIEHWDYASATGIARTMLELRVAFYYLCVDKCSEEEWECRWNIFNLHDCVSRARLFEAMEDTEQLRGFTSQAEQLRQRLRDNSYFKSLAPGLQRKYLHGQNAYLFPLETIAEQAGLDKRAFRWLYIFFSSHVHALPMSFYRMGQMTEEDRGRGLPSPVEENYTSLCLSLACTILVRTRDEVHELFAGIEKVVSEEELKAQNVDISSDAPILGTTMTIGQTIVVPLADNLVLEMTKTSDEAVDSVYRYQSDEVLRRTDSEGNGTTLNYFDPVFWTILVDNMPATQLQLDEMEVHQWAFKADHHTRVLGIKTA